MTAEAAFLAEHAGHCLIGQPFVTDDGWDARVLECMTCPGYPRIVQTRSVPAEGCLIDPDPHLPRGTRP